MPEYQNERRKMMSHEEDKVEETLRVIQRTFKICDRHYHAPLS